MGEEWISMAEYRKRYGLGYETVKNMIYKKEIEARETKGGQYRIRVNKDNVSREVYEAERDKRIKAETKLNLLKELILKEVR